MNLVHPLLITSFLLLHRLLSHHHVCNEHSHHDPFTDATRFQLRRSALRVLSSSPLTFVPKPRALSSLTASSIRARPVNRTVAFQQRWASSEAEAKKDEVVPISELQPTPQEEVENAIHEDNTAAATEGATSAQAVSEQADASDMAEAPVSDAFNNAPTRERTERTVRTPAEPKGTVYVGNLFFDVTETDLTNEFKKFGAIENVRIMRDSRGLSKG